MNHLLNIIARMLTAASLLAISTLAIASPQALATLQVPATVVGDDNAEQLHDEISPAQEQAMWSAIRHNVGLMQKQGVLIAPNIAQTVTYNFPLRMAAGLPDTAGFRVSAFVDHNPAIGSVLDYNGGSRTYDGHRGTDYALWPHNWNKVDAGAVEVIAAAAGTIAYKSDTDATDHHPCDAGSVNDQWNYVALVHADGRLSMYGHLRHNSLTSKGLGQTVAQGEYLGTVASSGNSSGPHMHFEMRSGNFTNEEWIDPYAGPHSQPGSMWASQRPYIDSAINKLSTHSAQPVDTPCQPTVTNVQDNFSTPAKIRFY
ncbi:MAG: M23 family metallopeptidase, partial [Pseudomonadota bacterium]